MNAVLFVSNFNFLELFLHTCMFLINYFTHNNYLVFFSFDFYVFIYLHVYIYVFTYSNNFDE